MMMDKENLLSDQQSLTLTLAATALSTNTIDLGAAGSIPLGGSPVYDIGRGEQPELHIQITSDVTSAGAATIEFQLVVADDAVLSTNLTVIQTTGPIAKAALVAGYQPRLQVPPGINRRYLGLKYINATAATTGGAVTAGFVYDRQTNPFVG